MGVQQNPSSFDRRRVADDSLSLLPTMRDVRPLAVPRRASRSRQMNSSPRRSSWRRPSAAPWTTASWRRTSASSSPSSAWPGRCLSQGYHFRVQGQVRRRLSHVGFCLAVLSAALAVRTRGCMLTQSPRRQPGPGGASSDMHCRHGTQPVISMAGLPVQLLVTQTLRVA